MKTLRCTHPHPDFPGQKCKAKVIVGDFGYGQVQCWRCHNWVSFDFTREGTVDSALVSV